MKEITYQDTLLVNSLCLFDSEPFGVMDENRIRSALGNQFQPYDTPELAFASVYKSLIINHGFMNGNKRTAAIVLYLASKLIDNDLKINDQEFANLTYQIASEGGSQIAVEDIAKQIFTKRSPKSETTKEVDVKELTTQFIKEHLWLMQELGK